MMRPDLADTPVGEIRTIDGVPMRHDGGGRFVPVNMGEPMFKRFTSNEGDTLHRAAA